MEKTECRQQKFCLTNNGKDWMQTTEVHFFRLLLFTHFLHTSLWLAHGVFSWGAPSALQFTLLSLLQTQGKQLGVLSSIISLLLCTFALEGHACSLALQHNRGHKALDLGGLGACLLACQNKQYRDQLGDCLLEQTIPWPVGGLPVRTNNMVTS